MDPHGTEQGGHSAGGVHLPDPSVWPLLVGLAFLFVGIALVWWSEVPDSNFAGPILGAAFVFTMVVIAGWATEDTRMKRQAEHHDLARKGTTRFTQVVTFALVDGAAASAQATGGVVDAIDQSDLRNVEGFQDLRINVSPALTGPAQVIVETTWSGREGLASYDATRGTLLDVINNHATQVLPGSVQVFDMEVVRDTKESSFKFGLGAAAALLGSLVVGGFMVGAGLSLFQSDHTVAATPGGNGGTAGPDPFLVIATDNKFNQSTITAAPNTDVVFTFENKGKAKHNLHFLTEEGGDTLAPGAEGAILDGGQSEKISFKTPAAGTYFFVCDIHPDQMKGPFEVKEGGPVPGGAGAAAGGGATTGPSLVATDNKFDKTALEGTAGKEFDLAFSNKGKAKHNVTFLDKEGGEILAPGAEGAIVDGGQSYTLKFTPPAAGTFHFVCEIHPDQMKGTFTVK